MLTPKALLNEPVLVWLREDTPLAVFDDPLVFDKSAFKPNAVLLAPVLLIFESPLPITVLELMEPTPLPIFIPLTVKSYAPRFTLLVAPEYGTTLLVQVKVPLPVVVNKLPFVPCVFG